ncbi:hypothetical protein L204_102426 [Cryptococcus depauperatus]
MSTSHSAVTAFTHNIPSFLRTPVEAVIGEQCYKTLVYDLNITNQDCLKYALSKTIGLAIVVGSSIVKIPQIITIVSTGSARGLSLSSYALETTAYGINLAYNSRNKFPFSTYGENFFMGIQNVIITLLILKLGPSSNTFGGGMSGIGSKQLAVNQNTNNKKVAIGAALIATACVFLWSDLLCPMTILALLQAATLPLSLIAKAPQIMSNHRNRSTGNLSPFAVFNGLLGCLARVFTNKQEVGDTLIFWGFVSASILNTVLAIQIIIYWPSGEEKEEMKRQSQSEKGIHTTPEKTESVSDGGGTGKRWARKLD